MRERLREAMHDCAAAVVFLTRIPVPWTVPDLEARLPRCTAWFPLIGVAVGGVGAGAWWLGQAIGNPLIGAVAAVAATVLLTGAFHEDGLADTFDGLGGRPDRDGALAVMQDSRIGTYGTLAVVLVLLGRVAALTSLGAMAPVALIGAHAVARFSSLPLIRWLPYARAGGTGKPFADGVPARALLAALAVTVALTLALWQGSAVIAWLAAAAVVALTAAWYRRRLAGITGDTLGASNQFAELACYLALLAMR